VQHFNFTFSAMTSFIKTNCVSTSTRSTFHFVYQAQWRIRKGGDEVMVKMQERNLNI